ncbi:MAG: hypothetical protein EPO32_14470 [Anaerolineae bacterium]|nr:MAG: hypothetical protein EPO32_14470 [Anaerolineae bacterium]
MQAGEPQIWLSWQEKISALNLSDVAAALLEAAGPLHLLGAQLVYLGEPLLGGLVPQDRLRALAHLLEDPQAAQDFARGLRGGAA